MRSITLSRESYGLPGLEAVILVTWNRKADSNLVSNTECGTCSNRDLPERSLIGRGIDAPVQPGLRISVRSTTHCGSLTLSKTAQTAAHRPDFRQISALLGERDAGVAPSCVRTITSGVFEDRANWQGADACADVLTLRLCNRGMAAFWRAGP